MSQSAQAAVLRAAPGRLSVEEVEIADPGPREVLVRTAAAGVCHSDLHILDGVYPWPVPAVLGHESAGVVEAVGPGVTYVAPGDHVVTCVSVFCGECEECITGRPALCSNPSVRRAVDDPPRLTQDGNPISQFAELGSFAERLLVHERAVVKIPADVPLESAALVGCAVITGVGAVFNTAAVKPGSTVAVVGCGGIGLSCIQGARLAGAARIIAIDRVPAKLERALALGATDSVDAGRDEPVSAVRSLTGLGVHYSFEAIGLVETVEQAFAMVRPGGTATVIGMLPITASVSIPALDLLAEKRLQGCLMGSNRFRLDMPRLLELYRQGRLELDEMISARLPLADINDGFETLRRGEGTRSVIVF
jgi:S-(hydroxymethyl)glutathione dehydrogenase / alcohol dehydrogenase